MAYRQSRRNKGVTDYDVQRTKWRSPLRAEAGSGITELGKEVRKNRGGEKTSVTKNSRNGKEEASPRRHGEHGEEVGKSSHGIATIQIPRLKPAKSSDVLSPR
jgi:hypothetical protein